MQAALIDWILGPVIVLKAAIFRVRGQFAVALDDIKQFLTIGADMFGEGFGLFRNITGHDAERFDHFATPESDQ